LQPVEQQPDDNSAPSDVLGAILGGTNSKRLMGMDIRTDGGTQPRAGLDAKYVDALVEDIQAGALLPPIDVMYDGTCYWLFDGFHRLAAQWKIAGEKVLYVDARVHMGSQADAQWASYAANKSHGLRRSNEDKKRAVLAALRHPNGASRANREIARHLGVDEKTIRFYREGLESTAEITQSNERVGADGRRIDTTKIGARPYAPIWEIQNCVREGLRKFTPRQIRISAAERSGVPWTDSAQALDGAGLRYRQNDLVQALNNQADMFEHTERPSPPLEVASGAEPVAAEFAATFETSEVQVTPGSEAVAKQMYVPEFGEPLSLKQELRMYAAKFRDLLGETEYLDGSLRRWGDLTGRHLATAEAKRGLRKMLEITEQELALLGGEGVEK
jgi:hypothetical protein